MRTYLHPEVFYLVGISQDPLTEIKAWVDDSVVIPEWLNAARNHESASRVSRLVDKLRHLQTEIDAYADPGEPLFAICDERISASIPDVANKILGHQEELVKTLSEYGMCHGIEHDWDGSVWSLPLVPETIPGEFVLLRECYLRDGNVSLTGGGNDRRVIHQVGEGSIVVRIMILARSGNLCRLRRCKRIECSKWFYAYNLKTIYCTKQCRLDDYVSAPDKKEQRKIYKRQYRLEGKKRLSLEGRFRDGVPAI